MSVNVQTETKTSRPPRRARLVIRFLRAALEGYAVIVILYGAVRILVGGSLSVIDLFNNLMPALLMPALVALPLMLLLRQWRTAVLLVPALLGFVVYVRADAPSPTPPPDRQSDLVIMTQNIHSTNDRFDLIGAGIVDSNADVVLLQEAIPRVLRRIPDDVETAYPYSIAHQAPEPRLGLTILSRYPLLSDDFSVFAPESSRWRFQIAVDDRIVTIYTVHLANPLLSPEGPFSGNHDQAIATLRKMLAQETTPLIVAGDFNMTDLSSAYQLMTGDLIDSFHESGSGLGLTFPANTLLPLVRIDYVFHSADFVSLKTEVLPNNNGSDHFPVRAELAFAN